MDEYKKLTVDVFAELLKLMYAKLEDMGPGSLNYSQADYLFDLTDALSEKLEELRATAPDSPDAEEDD